MYEYQCIRYIKSIGFCYSILQNFNHVETSEIALKQCLVYLG